MQSTNAMYYCCLPCKVCSFVGRFSCLLRLQVGGRVQQADVTSLDELAHYDAVVNCAGLGSLKLFSSDQKMVPVRWGSLAGRGSIATEQTATLCILPAELFPPQPVLGTCAMYMSSASRLA